MTRADKLIAALERLPPDQLDSIRPELRAILQRKPRDELGLTPLKRAYSEALLVYEDAVIDGAATNAALRLAMESNSLVARHSASFEKIATNPRKYRTIHTAKNQLRQLREVGLLRERPP
jgi:hypothetical protein